MVGIIKFRVEPELRWLMNDEQFKKRIIRAYETQVEQNHGWGFNVRCKGYSIRFDIDDRASSRGLTVYMGYAVEEPKNRQTTLLEVLG